VLKEMPEIAKDHKAMMNLYNQVIKNTNDEEMINIIEMIESAEEYRMYTKK
jgi:hypothetical protein